MRGALQSMRAVAAGGQAVFAISLMIGLGAASPALAQGPLRAQAQAQAQAQPQGARAAALQRLSAPDAETRLAAVRRLAEVGTMADVERLARTLRDASEPVRSAAAAALWAVWSRSGVTAIDRKLAEGTRLMSEGELGPALALFDEVVRALPSFAEGWNKRATVLFMLGRNAESLQDCDEVIKRNPHHYGALSGMAQIHLRRGDVEQALKAYERALEVNPNLEGGPGFLRMLQEAVRERRNAAAGRST
ncbi:MAG: tetratricopeptide repeat protein [Rubrivivax sp.]|nr:tetratricopeptide repeat protein [Rubrivivax sp.]